MSAFRGIGSVPSALALAITLLVAGVSCATLREVAALRDVDFEFDRVSDVRLAGVLVDETRTFDALGPADVARLAAAVAAKDVPLELIVHVRAENPAENDVTARLVGLDWTFFVEDDALVAGRFDDRYAFPPGTPVDVPVDVTFDAYDAVQGNARSLFELALAVAGVAGFSKEVRLDVVPGLETPYGPIRSPGRITLRREVGSATSTEY